MHTGIGLQRLSSDKKFQNPGGTLSDRVTNTDALLVWYATPDALRDAWAHDLALGALFVQTSGEYAAGERVRVVIELPFCEGSVDVEGEVVGSITEEMETAGATPGIAVQTDLPITALRARMEELTGITLPENSEGVPEGDSRPPRYPAESPVVIEMEGRHFTARTADISYNGMLALLPGIDLGQDSEVKVQLPHPTRDEQLEVEGRVARQTRCDHGVMAVGIRFNYGFERVDDVTRFIDEMRGFHRARKLTGVTGSLSHTALEHVLETFTSVASFGTLVLKRGKDEGKIAYRDGEIVCSVTGLVAGPKALGRMFTWPDATFEFQSEVDPDDQTSPIPLDSAIVTAAIERDEIARLELDNLVSAKDIALDEARFSEVESELGPVHREVAENAGMGFPPAALLDILTQSDAAIYRALADLIDVGVLSVA